MVRRAWWAAAVGKGTRPASRISCNRRFGSDRGQGQVTYFPLLSYQAMICFEGKPREVGQLLHVEAHPQHLHIMMPFLCTDSSLSGSDPKVVACCNCPRIVGRTWFAVADQRSAAQIAET